jgi:hypothetical protein
MIDTGAVMKKLLNYYSFVGSSKLAISMAM